MTRLPQDKAAPVVDGLIDVGRSQQVVRQEGPGDIEAHDTHEQFVQDVAQWIQAWLDAMPADEANASFPAVFLFSGDTRVDQIFAESTPLPGFRMATDALVSGNAYCCSLAMRGAHRTHIGFQQATDALTWCSTGHYAAFTAVIFVPKTRHALVVKAGEDPDDCKRLHFGPPRTSPFTFDQVDQVLDDFHEDWTKMHTGHCRIWAVPSKRKLKEGPEGQIQGALVGYLKLVVRAGQVDQEVFTRGGRSDVRITRWDADGSFETCYLELKVLRKDKTDQWNVDWALGGIQQVLGYREKEQTRGPSYLCCYDGRELDRRMVRVENAARKANVIPKRFFMETKFKRS